MTDEYVPADRDAAITLAVDGCLVLAAGQADMVWGHPSVGTRRVASPGPLRAGYRYLLRQVPSRPACIRSS